jgi:hypothetical protein
MVWTILGVAFIIFQVMAWIGGGGISVGAAGYNTTLSTTWSIGYTIGANIALILGIIFLMLGFYSRAKKKAKAAAKAAAENAATVSNEVNAAKEPTGAIEAPSSKSMGQVGYEKITGATSHGGAYAEIYYFDENGNFVDKSKAVKAVVRECDNNGEVISESWLN